MGVYPLPIWDIQVSGAFQSLPGPTYSGTRSYSRAEIRGLPAGRTLSTGTINLTIVEPNSVFGPHVNKFDARFSKIVRIGGYRVTGSLDIFNLFNSAGHSGREHDRRAELSESDTGARRSAVQVVGTDGLLEVDSR